MRDFGDDDPPTTVTDLGRNLLDVEQVVPQDSLFHDDIFRRSCRETEDRNEAMIIQDTSRLLVPSAKNVAKYGDRHLDVLTENVNEARTGSIPVEGPRPQPDYCTKTGGTTKVTCDSGKLAGFPRAKARGTKESPRSGSRKTRGSRAAAERTAMEVCGARKQP
ncbi:MAG: hypothetical protein Q9190_000710 [Brigantiaea leucoxantha]